MCVKSEIRILAKRFLAFFETKSGSIKCQKNRSENYNVYSYSLNKSDFPFKFVLAKILLYYFLSRRIEEELGANAKFAGEKFRRPLQ